MIPINDLTAKKEKVDLSISEIDEKLVFDHYGIKVFDSDSYDKTCRYYGEKTNEVVLSNRRVATVVDKDGIVFEILEPKEDENISTVFLDHYSYRTDNYDDLRNNYNKVEAEFSFGETRGFKINLNGDLIEFKNDKLTESKVD